MSALPRPLPFPIEFPRPVAERRRHRRHDLEHRGIVVTRCDKARGENQPLGQIMDLSAAGVRVRTRHADVRTDRQIRVRLELPAYAGISPFIDTSRPDPRPSRQWTGWMSVNRVRKVAGDQYDVAGVLVDMQEMDRGMLGLYLSTQPLAA